MPQSFKTIFQASTEMYIIKKSKFIANAFPVANEFDAIDFIHRKKEAYRDATHNCFAYIIGHNAGISRYSDGGEPGGTAGIPILDAIKARGIVNCCIVVTRYFGGVLLGTGGLARAYSHSASLAVNAASVVLMQPGIRYMLEIAYPFWDKAMYIIEQNSSIIKNIEFSEIVRVMILVRQSSHQQLISQLRLLTGDRIKIEIIGEAYATWPE
jgi:uncharacterized YigZ family protein